MEQGSGLKVPRESTRSHSVQESRLEMGGEAQTGLRPSLRPWALAGPPFILPRSLPFQSRSEAQHRPVLLRRFLLLPSFIQATNSTEGLPTEGPRCAGQGARSWGTRGPLSQSSCHPHCCCSILITLQKKQTGKEGAVRERRLLEEERSQAHP